MAKLSILFVTLFAVVLVCYGAVPHKREVQQNTLATDASQALDQILQDLNAGIRKIANDGVNLDGVVANLTSKASELGQRIQQLGQEVSNKVQEAAKNQGLVSQK